MESQTINDFSTLIYHAADVYNITTSMVKFFGKHEDPVRFSEDQDLFSRPCERGAIDADIKRLKRSVKRGKQFDQRTIEAALYGIQWKIESLRREDWFNSVGTLRKSISENLVCLRYILEQIYGPDKWYTRQYSVDITKDMNGKPRSPGELNAMMYLGTPITKYIHLNNVYLVLRFV